MALEKFRGDDKDITYKTALVQRRRTGSYMEGGSVVKGEIVETELTEPTFDGEDALDTLLDGVEPDEIDEGHQRLMSENPALASQGMHDYLDRVADDMTFDDGNRFYEPKRAASVKRVGMLMDSETGDTINFRRMKATGQVELTDEGGGVIDTLASSEFDELLDAGTYTVL